MKSVVISKKDLKYNIKKIKEYANKNLPNDNGNRLKIIAVVKQNGYGLGIVEYTKFLAENGIDFFAVATTEEAIIIRKSGIKEKLLLLSPVTDKKEIKTLIENNVILTIGSKESAENVNEVADKLNKIVNVHLKIDTGFGRYGFVYSNREDIIKTIKMLKNINIEGTFTHFSNSFYDDKYTKMQFERFISCIEVLKMNEIDTGVLHVCNTSAFIKFPLMHLNAVRIGSGFLGKILFENSMNLKEIGYLKANVSEIKKLPKGFNVGYSNIYKTKKETTIAIISCGYADGVNIEVGRDTFRFIDNIRCVVKELKILFRKQKLYVMINGNKCDILGRIGTCYITADITGKNINIGDEVIFDTNIKYVDSSIRREWN